MNQVIAHAPSKINLVLEVEPLIQGEEKHRLSSIFCTTALSDTLIFDFTSTNDPFNARILIESVDLNTSFINKNNNTLTKIVDCFIQEYGKGFLPSGTLDVRLIKSIPIQAGLGGGSTDAAAMLRMLCWLAQVEPTSERNLAIARSVGADVPFFVLAPKAGFCAYMDGYGDMLKAALPKPNLSLVLVKPSRGVSTKKAYGRFDAEGYRAPNSNPAALMSEALLQEGATVESIAALCSNNLEKAAAGLLPEVKNIKAQLLAEPGVLGAALSGSGSAVFAICEDEEAARRTMQHFADKGYWAVATQT